MLGSAPHALERMRALRLPLRAAPIAVAPVLPCVGCSKCTSRGLLACRSITRVTGVQVIIQYQWVIIETHCTFRRYMGHMTLVANRVGAASARRRVVRGYLDASAEWEEYSNGYLRVRMMLRQLTP